LIDIWNLHLLVMDVLGWTLMVHQDVEATLEVFVGAYGLIKRPLLAGWPFYCGGVW
jgi:hypothetical protein